MVSWGKKQPYFLPKRGEKIGSLVEVRSFGIIGWSSVELREPNSSACSKLTPGRRIQGAPTEESLQTVESNLVKPCCNWFLLGEK